MQQQANKCQGYQEPPEAGRRKEFFFFFLGTFIGKNGTAYILFWTSSLQKCENKFCHSKPSFPKLCYGHLRKLMHPLQSRYFQHKRGYVKFLCNTEVITFLKNYLYCLKILQMSPFLSPLQKISL